MAYISNMIRSPYFTCWRKSSTLSYLFFLGTSFSDVLFAFQDFLCLLFNILFVFLNLPCVLLFDVSGFFGFFWCLAFLCIMFDIFHIFIFSILIYGFFFNVISSLNYLSFLFWIIFLFLAFNPLYYFAGTCSLFNEFLIALLALSVQSTLINCIWNYRVSE